MRGYLDLLGLILKLCRKELDIGKLMGEKI